MEVTCNETFEEPVRAPTNKLEIPHMEWNEAWTANLLKTGDEEVVAQLVFFAY